MPSPSTRSALAASIRTTGSKVDYYKRNAMARRLRLMERYGIDLVLDVGANTGQYARALRQAGYAGEIVSFEPLAHAYASLARSAARDGRWRAVQLAIGAHDRAATLRVSGDSRASSLLKMRPLHEEAGSCFATVGEERVTVRRLDSIWSEHVPAGSSTYLKVDAQGYERHVIAGAARSLALVKGVQLELSLRSLYEGEMLLPAALRSMQRRGFELVSLEYGFCHPETGEMLQVDGIFKRSGA